MVDTFGSGARVGTLLAAILSDIDVEVGEGWFDKAAVFARANVPSRGQVAKVVVVVDIENDQIRGRPVLFRLHAEERGRLYVKCESDSGQRATDPTREHWPVGPGLPPFDHQTGGIKMPFTAHDRHARKRP